MNLAHGPDGALYITDFYREIIEDYSAIPRYLQQQYGLTNGMNYGRIWRLTHVQAPKTPVADMASLSNAALAGEVGERFFSIIRDRFELTRDLVLRLTGEDELLDREPILQRSIRLRNPYVDPMSLVQVDLLRRWRERERDDPELEKALFTTVRGIARGLRNTG